MRIDTLCNSYIHKAMWPVLLSLALVSTIFVDSLFKFLATSRLQRRKIEFFVARSKLKCLQSVFLRAVVYNMSTRRHNPEDRNAHA